MTQSPPTTPSRHFTDTSIDDPITPPKVPSAPGVKITLPTPPSFAAHRARSYSITSPGSPSRTPPPKSGSASQRKKGHSRSVSFNNEVDIRFASPVKNESGEGDDEEELSETVENQEALDEVSNIYKIPQRQYGQKGSHDKELWLNSAKSTSHEEFAEPLVSPTPTFSPRQFRRAPPSALTLMQTTLKSPTTVVPPLKTAPAQSRLSFAAAAKGLSISPSVPKTGLLGASGRKAQNRHSFTLGDNKHSIWSATGPGTALGAGWITPGLASAKSVASAGGRQRGLTVAVIDQDKQEMLVEGQPLTPRLPLGSARLNLPKVTENENENGDLNIKQVKEGSASEVVNGITHEGKRREIILCRYYHTPGLTCTSRPCRFVHNLDTALSSLKSPTKTLASGSPDISKYRMLSPSPRTAPITDNGHSSDPTSGTFAEAQKSARRKSLTLQSSAGGLDFEVDMSDVAPGEMVVVAGSVVGGEDLVGTVFLMSGGGKGPAGKSKAKFKTVPCKDYAEGNCPYGEYCSFIHENKANDEVTGITPAEPAPTPLERGTKSKKPKDLEIGVNVHQPPVNAWLKPLLKVAKTPVLPNFDHAALDSAKAGLSAFAAPYFKEPVKVNEQGALVKEATSPRSAETLTKVAMDTSAKPKQVEFGLRKPRASAWSKGPPKSLEPIKIIEPEPSSPPGDEGPRTPSSGLLIPPTSAISMYTESDPATPWDPAIRRQKSMELRHSNLSDIPDVEYPTLSSPLYNPYDSQYNHRSYAYDSSSQSQTSDGLSNAQYPMMDFYAPTYPWGIPMSPLPFLAMNGSQKQDQPQNQTQVMDNNSGVLWTPAGWAVQDAAMKSVLKQVEAKSNGLDVKFKPGKHYYRKRPCKFFAEGDCPHGDDCTFLHVLPTSLEAAGLASIKTNITPRLPCKFFNSAGGCHNGTSCTFLHTLVVPENVPLVDKPRAWRTRPCRHFQLGRCTLGETCGFAHVIDPVYAPIEYEPSQGDINRSTVGCYDYAKEGRCRRGVKCRFQHLTSGSAGKEEDHSLTEAKVKELMEIGSRSDWDGDASEEEEDDVEIVTANASPVRLGVAA